MDGGIGVISSKNSSLVRSLLIGVLAFASASVPAYAVSASAFRLEQESQTLAKQKIGSIITKYCGDSCELINVEAFIDESASEPEDIGFESVVGEAGPKLSVARLVVDMQVDDRVTAADRERLGKLITNGLRNLAPAVNVRWTTVAFPQIGVTTEVEDRLKTQLQQKVQSVVQGTIDAYCPSECVLANAMVEGRLVSPDESRGVSERELVRDRTGRGILRIDNIDVDVSIDKKMPEANRSKIYNLIKMKTKFAYPLNLNLTVVDFPENPESQTTKDPWGLDRLRQTLQIFRDLASTKEIITSTNTQTDSKLTSSSEKNELSSSKESSSSSTKEKSSASSSSSNSMSSSEKAALTEKESTKASEVSASKSEGSQNYEYAAYIGGFLLLAGIIVAMIMRLSSATKDAKIMMSAASNQGAPGWNVPQQHAQGNPGASVVGANGQVIVAGTSTVSAVSPERLALRFKIDSIREEILRTFTENPKVARDVFTRMLQEDGVETTSKYVHVFGPMVVFELMNDPNLQRDLYDLSEFYHKSSFDFTEEQKLELLNALRTKVTASEIRLMARRRTEQFDFLQNLDAPQVFTLISEEKAQVQSIVLTQLDHNRRRAVFDMYVGDQKVALMRELCRADAIPKEYLGNVAKALHKKVLSRNEFDTEQLRSNDIILDLLEKASLDEQRLLMADLAQTNAEASRAIKLKLITVEMLAYLKDGHLLEIVMGLEREDLLAFLVGVPNHIRDLLLTKAPGELAASWIEEIEQLAGVDEATYRLAELKIINRIRTLANSGAIRLIDVNDRIFASELLADARRHKEQMDVAVSKNSMAA